MDAFTTKLAALPDKPVSTSSSSAADTVSAKQFGKDMDQAAVDLRTFAILMIVTVVVCVVMDIWGTVATIKLHSYDEVPSGTKTATSLLCVLGWIFFPPAQLAPIIMEASARKKRKQQAHSQLKGGWWNPNTATMSGC